MADHVYNVKEYGLRGDGLVDDTAALQALIERIALAHTNAVIYFPDEGPYLLDGPFQDTARSNCVIQLPAVGISEKYYTITLRGCSTPTFSPSAFSTQPLPSATVLKSTKNVPSGNTPSLFGGIGPAGGDNFECSYVGIGFENLIVQLPPNPQLTAINLDHYTASYFRNTAVLAPSLCVMHTAEPLQPASFGVIQPHFSSGIFQRVEELLVIVGFYNGIRIGENCCAEYIEIYSCRNAAVFDFSHGVSKIERLTAGWCKTHLVFRDTHATQIGLLNTERWDPSVPSITSAWYDFVADISDPHDKSRGEVTYQSARANVGYYPQQITVEGGKHLAIRELGQEFVR